MDESVGTLPFGSLFLCPSRSASVSAVTTSGDHQSIIAAFHFVLRPQGRVRRRPRPAGQGEQATTPPPRTQAPPQEEGEGLRRGQGRWQGIPHLRLEAHSLFFSLIRRLLLLLTFSDHSVCRHTIPACPVHPGHRGRRP